MIRAAKVIALPWTTWQINVYCLRSYNVGTGEGSRLLVNPVFAQLKAVLFGFFLTAKDRSFDAFDLHNRV